MHTRTTRLEYTIGGTIDPATLDRLLNWPDADVVLRTHDPAEDPVGRGAGSYYRVAQPDFAFARSRLSTPTIGWYLELTLYHQASYKHDFLEEVLTAAQLHYRRWHGPVPDCAVGARICRYDPDARDWLVLDWLELDAVPAIPLDYLKVYMNEGHTLETVYRHAYWIAYEPLPPLRLGPRRTLWNGEFP